MRSQKTILAVVICLGASLVCGSVGWAVQAGPKHQSASESRGPDRCLLGAYLVNLADFNYSAGTFRAEMWIWTHTSPARNSRPLRSMEFPNAVDPSASLDSTLDKDGVRWAQRKVTGTFRHHWNLRNFPFDRHRLEIRIEEGVADTSVLVYEPDKRNSSYRRDMQLDDWKIVGFDIVSSPVTYSSTFGDPGLPPGSTSQYAGFKVDITVERTELTSYFKLTAVAYVCFLLMLITCFIHMDHKDRALDAMGTRIALLAGALFACVLNMRSASSVLGSEDGITLLDKVHVVVLLYIVVAATLAVFNRSMLARGWSERRLKQIDLWAAGIAILTFAAINALLLAQAAWGQSSGWA